MSSVKQAKFLRRFPLFLRLAIIAAVGLILLAGLIVLIIWQWYQLGQKPVDTRSVALELFVVEQGQSLERIAEALKDRELIRNTTVFEWYVRVGGDYSEFQAGDFEVSPSMTVAEIVEILKYGQASNRRVTIFPNRRLDQLATSLQEQGFTDAIVTTSLSADRWLDHPVARWWPAGSASLEGYLYPETFNVTGFEQSDADSLIRRSLNEFSRVLKDNPDLEAGFQQQQLSVHEAVILASIVTSEASRPEDLAKVAQVFLKRYHLGRPLGADPPVFYAHFALGRPLDFSVDHDYNTRLRPGLPAGAISNVGLEPLRAVANPADTDYYFFLAGDDGTIYFNETLDGHNRDRRLYCHEACKLPTR